MAFGSPCLAIGSSRNQPDFASSQENPSINDIVWVTNSGPTRPGNFSETIRSMPVAVDSPWK